MFKENYSVPQSGTLDMTSYSNYKNITADNIILDVKNNVIGSQMTMNAGTYPITKSYDSTTGKLTLSRTYGLGTTVDVYIVHK